MKLLTFRLLAFVIDSIFLFFVAIIGIVLSGYYGFIWHFTDTIILLLLAIGYFGTFDGLNRATLGKHIFRLTVKLNNGKKLTIFDGYLRSILFFGGPYVIAFICDFLFEFVFNESIITQYFYDGYGYIFPYIFVWSIILGKGSAGLHDAISNTIVCFEKYNTPTYKPITIIIVTFMISILFTIAIGSKLHISDKSKFNLYSTLEMNTKIDDFYGNNGVLRYILREVPGVYDIHSNFLYKYKLSDLLSPNNDLMYYSNESGLKLTLNIHIKVSSYKLLTEDFIEQLFDVITKAVNNNRLFSSIQEINLQLIVTRSFGSLHGNFAYNTTGIWNNSTKAFDIVIDEDGKSVSKSVAFGIYLGPYFGHLMHPDINEKY
ncbi:MAG: RDD family protein [Candidatus Thiodiazotropha endolucinida]